MKFSYFKTSNSNRKVSVASIGRGFTSLISKVAPKFSGYIGEQILMRPYGKRHYGQTPITPSEQLQLPTSIGHAHINLYGQGQNAIILSHGWADTSQCFKQLIPVLVEQGYLVAAIDHIGHGKSTGNKAHLASFIETKRLLIEHLNNQRVTIKGIVGHSMGAVAALNLSRLELSNKKIVLIASPIKFFELMFEKIEQVGISRQFAIRVLERITKQYDLIWQHLSPENQRSKLDLDITFIHDKKDRYAPFSHIENFLGENNQALITTEGLGHSRILGDTKVVNTINQVLTANQALTANKVLT